jgi:hypothetical protein
MSTEPSQWDLVATLHVKAQQAVADNLAQDEAVRVVIHGVRSTAMIGTDRRVFIFKTGASAGAGFGAKLASYDYRNIGGVQYQFGFATGSVVLDISGAAPVGRGAWETRNNDPRKAANAIQLNVLKRAENERAIAKLSELIADWHCRSHQPEVLAEQADLDIPDQIRKLAELRDTGFLTTEEFEATKAELLARM